MPRELTLLDMELALDSLGDGIFQLLPHYEALGWLLCQWQDHMKESGSDVHGSSMEMRLKDLRHQERYTFLYQLKEAP
jgi:hypothetical protein